MAGLSPMYFPMILGINIKSCMSCDTQYTTITNPNCTQKSEPVDTVLTRHRMAAIGMEINCRYGTMLSNPMNSPSTIAMGRSIIQNPMQNDMPTKKDTVACPLKYRFMLLSTSSMMEKTRFLYLGGTMLLNPAITFSKSIRMNTMYMNTIAQLNMLRMMLNVLSTNGHVLLAASLSRLTHSSRVINDFRCSMSTVSKIKSCIAFGR